MIYQFSFRAPTVQAAIDEATRRLNAEASEAELNFDNEVALVSLRSVLALFNVTEKHELLVNMNGSATWAIENGQVTNMQSAGVGCAVGLLNRPLTAAVNPPAATQLPLVEASPSSGEVSAS